MISEYETQNFTRLIIRRGNQNISPLYLASRNSLINTKIYFRNLSSKKKTIDEKSRIRIARLFIFKQRIRKHNPEPFYYYNSLSFSAMSHIQYISEKKNNKPISIGTNRFRGHRSHSLISPSFSTQLEIYAHSNTNHHNINRRSFNMNSCQNSVKTVPSFEIRQIGHC